jgi:hypothetical protein
VARTPAIERGGEGGAGCREPARAHT